MLNISGLVATLLVSIAFSSLAEAKVFRNSYVSFELPNAWDCVLDGTEYVCRSKTNLKDSREAIIILTAKEVGPTDNLTDYEQHLKTPRTLPSRAGQATRSKVERVEVRTIANHPWVDGLHLGSEIPNYYTRYLATVKDRIGLLVTFSAHKLHYTKYAQDFIRAIASLRVLSTKNMLANQNVDSKLPGSGKLGPDMGGAIPADMGNDFPDELSGGGLSGSKAIDIILALLVLVGGGAGYFILKKRGKSKKKIKKKI